MVLVDLIIEEFKEIYKINKAEKSQRIDEKSGSNQENASSSE